MQAGLLGLVASVVLHPLFLLLLGWTLLHGGLAMNGRQALFDGYFEALIPLGWLVMMLARGAACQRHACQDSQPFHRATLLAVHQWRWPSCHVGIFPCSIPVE
jgi:hypothetical protein